MLGLIDVAPVGVIGSPDAPPLIVSLGVAALGSPHCYPWCPRGGALIAIVVIRLISAVLAVPALMTAPQRRGAPTPLPGRDGLRHGA
jgi:hypothetical protein